MDKQTYERLSELAGKPELLDAGSYVLGAMDLELIEAGFCAKRMLAEGLCLCVTQKGRDAMEKDRRERFDRSWRGWLVKISATIIPGAFLVVLGALIPNLLSCTSRPPSFSGTAAVRVESVAPFKVFYNRECEHKPSEHRNQEQSDYNPSKRAVEDGSDADSDEEADPVVDNHKLISDVFPAEEEPVEAQEASSDETERKAGN